MALDLFHDDCLAKYLIPYVNKNDLYSHDFDSVMLLLIHKSIVNGLCACAIGIIVAPPT